jgi:proton-dependent oligopeptide transporter, POT family
MSVQELTNFLWDAYNPSDIWIVYSGVAVSAVVLLWFYNRFILK